MNVIAHLSDTHFGTELPQVMHALASTLQEIRPDVTLISGDLTQRARLSQFRATRAFLQALPGSMKFVIPGNHDIPLFNLPLRLLDPYRNYRDVFGPREGFWRCGNIGIMGLDATSRWRHTQGKLLASQLQEAIAHARSVIPPDGILIACAHQPLAVAWPEDQENVLVGAPDTAWFMAGQGVDVALSGHVHVPLMTTTRTAFPEMPRHFILSGAGTAISHRTRPNAPNSFNVLRIPSDCSCIAVTLMEYQARGQFQATGEKIFSRGDMGWQEAP